MSPATFEIRWTSGSPRGFQDDRKYCVREKARLLSQGPQDEAKADQEQYEEDEPDDEEFDDDEDFDEEELAASAGIPTPTSVLPKMTEKRVNIGDKVCAVGTYNELQQGLLPKGRGSTPNRLIRGSARSTQVRR